MYTSRIDKYRLFFDIQNKNQVWERLFFFDRFGRVVLEVDIQPDGTGETKNVSKEKSTDSNEQRKRGQRAPAKYPMKDGNEANAEPAHEDVGNEHGAIVEAGFGHVIHVAMIAAIFHIEGAIERKGACVEQVGRMALWAFQAEDAV